MLQQMVDALDLIRQIGRLSVRAKAPDDLYAEIGEEVLANGLFKHVWIGIIDSVSLSLIPLVSRGAGLSLPGSQETANAVAEKVYLTDSLQVIEETAYGTIGLPLHERERIVGVLLLQIDQAGFFNADIARLFSEMAEDISLALNNIASEERRLVAETKLQYLAFYDSQTGLPNQTMLEQRLTSFAAHIEEHGGLLILVDIKLQRVDQVLQLLGNAGMDEVLRELALRLEQKGGVNTFVSQLAPDEFCLAVLEKDDSSKAMILAHEVHAILAEPVKFEDKEIFIQASVGGAVYPIHENNIQYLLRRARAAAERFGEQAVRLYSPDLDRGLEQRIQMTADLHRALERDEFLLYYQPQLNLKTGEVVGAEALLRWEHPKRGIISPALFIPLLEELGLMPAVGTWVLRTACREAKQWQEQGFGWLRVAVNMSAQQFRLADLISTVKAALDDSGLEARYLELELTESLILESAERTIQTMHDLKRMGVSLSLDDFGTGYSSLSYLRHYPVDRIKIDQSFVRDLIDHPGSAALVRSILSMAGNLDLTTIAEGVETVGQYGYLRKQLCQEMQGFLFSRPVPNPEFVQMLHDGKKFETLDNAAEASITVLLVDDESNFLAAMRRAFRNENWKLLTASRADDGLELLARHSIGVVISDQRMAGISGTEFLNRVKKMYPETIRILLTGYADFTTVIDAVNQGDLYKVLSKPIDDKLLREHIREALRRYEIVFENRRMARRLESLGDSQEVRHLS